MLTTHLDLSSDTTAPHCYWVENIWLVRCAEAEHTRAADVNSSDSSPKIRDVAKFLDNNV